MISSASDQIRHDLYTFTDLPPEILEQIARRLCDQKKQAFDTIANIDLQNLRLTSRALCLVATPVLFENLVFDEKFLEPQQLSRIIEFAAQNPDLANCVRRLQHRVAPILLEDAPGILGTHAAAKICAGAGTAALSIKLTRGKLKTKEIDTLLLDPIRRWVWNGLARKHRQPPGSEKEEATYAQYHPAFLKTVSALPNLAHVEIAHSEHLQDHVKGVVSQLNGKHQINVQLPTIVEKSVLIQAVSIAAEQSHEFMHAGIVSLKLQGLDFNPQSSKDLQTLSHLTHLDLEYCVCVAMASGNTLAPHRSICTAQLNKYLCTLINLRGLRLSCHPGFYRRRLPDSPDSPSQPFGMFGPMGNTEEYYFDAALNNCVWPHLRNLALARWPMRRAGLRNIITSHAATLRELELDRMSLLKEQSFADNKSAWLLIAQSCAGCQDLRSLQITKPWAHYWFLGDDSETEKFIFDEPGADGDRYRIFCMTSLCYNDIDEVHRAAGHVMPAHTWRSFPGWLAGDQ